LLLNTKTDLILKINIEKKNMMMTTDDVNTNIEETISSLSTSMKNCVKLSQNLEKKMNNEFDSIVIATAIELAEIENNKNKITLKGENINVDIIKDILKSININAKEMVHFYSTNKDFFVIKLSSHELKLKALVNVKYIKDKYNVHVNDCLTQRQRLNASMLRAKKNELNNKLSFKCDKGSFDIDITGKFYYYDVRGGKLKKILKKKDFGELKQYQNYYNQNQVPDYLQNYEFNIKNAGYDL